MLVYFNNQAAPFLRYPTPHEYVKLHRFKPHLQSVPGQLQMLYDPDIVVVELFCKTLKRTICLVRVLDNEGSFKLILELSDEF